MRLTIGEVANELLKYSNSVNMSMVNGKPFLRATLSTESNFARAYMYIIQEDEMIYSACDYIDDSSGNRFFPTGNISKPFIREADKIHELFGGDSSYYSLWYSSVNQVSYTGFLEYLYERLMFHGITKITKQMLETKITDLGFANIKLRRSIERAFMDHGNRRFTIGDLINIVNKRKERFNLSNLRSRDFQTVISKLKEVGIIATTRNGCIIDITFERKSH